MKLRGTRDELRRALHASRWATQEAGHQWDEADVMAALEPFLTDEPPRQQPPEGTP